ncbi:MAG: V-type ATP synthase subunit D, partial [Alphaproteobacteria bacterium]
RVLCAEIEKTHRRTNALEYAVIPDLQSTARRITRQLEEFARSAVSRLMKVKDMLAAREAAR